MGRRYRRLIIPLMRLHDELIRQFPERPFSIEFWDGTRIPSTSAGGPTFRLTSPDALLHLLRAPGQLGLGRAYAAGALEVDDLDALIDLLNGWQAPRLDVAARARLGLAALRAVGRRRPPPRPAAELLPRGRRHSVARDRRAVRHHYDVSNDFFALFLDSTMTYSCAVFRDGAETLEEAQQVKLEMVCRKLELEPGARVLDVGCGWGSFAMHAARHHDVSVVGITLSAPQAELARERAARAGLSDRVEIRVQDYRELGGDRFDAIASIGMVEHVGERQIDAYAGHLAAALEPGGRLLNHGIARLRHHDPPAGAFSDRYVFPDASPLHLSRVARALETAGLEIDHVEGFRSDYERTLTHWIERLERRLDDAVQHAGPERVRVWRIYLRAARNGFRIGFTSVYQVRCRRA